MRCAPTLIILVVFALTLSGLTRESLWIDETWTLWAVRDGWGELWQRVAGDVHPPLYFLLLRGWTLVVGESSFAVRYLSVGMGSVALSLTYALGRKLFDRATALIAMVWLGSNGLWIYYARETRMYMMVILLAALAFWCYWRWLQRPTAHTPIVWLALANGALLYTHYAAAFLVITEAIHLSLTQRRRLPGFLGAALLTLLLYLPWLPIFLQQHAMHPDGLSHGASRVEWSTIRWLLWALSGGVGLLLIVPYLFGKGLQIFLTQRKLAWLLVLWILVSPLSMLLLTAWGIGILEVRYLVGLLPAMALLGAHGIRHVKWQTLTLLFLLIFVGANLSSLSWVRPAKAPWEAKVRAALSIRQPNEPTLIALIEGWGPESYYDRVLGMQNSYSVDLTPLRHQPNVLQQVLEQVVTAPSIWVMMPSNIAATWQVVATLNETHEIGYRDAVGYMIFYRFDRNGKEKLALRFGDKMRFPGPLFAEHPQLTPGAHYCRQLDLQALQDLPPAYSISMQLINGRNQLVVQQDLSLGMAATGTTLTQTVCLDLPVDLSPGFYGLHLVLYRQVDGRRLPIYEKDIQWGDALILDVVNIEPKRIDTPAN